MPDNPGRSAHRSARSRRIAWATTPPAPRMSRARQAVAIRPQTVGHLRPASKSIPSDVSHDTTLPTRRRREGCRCRAMIPRGAGVRRVTSAYGRYSPAGGCGADEVRVEPSPPSWRGLRERRRRRRFSTLVGQPSPPRSSRGSRSSRVPPREALAAAPPPSPGRRRVSLTSPSET